VAALNSFEPIVFLHCAVPRIKQPMAKVVTADAVVSPLAVVLILLFEAFAMALIEREMPVN